MKYTKITTIAVCMVLALCSAVQADIWSENFNSGITIANDDVAWVPGEHTLPAGGTTDWFGLTANVENKFNTVLRVAATSGGSTRSAAIVLDSGLFSAGSYTLKFDALLIQGNADLNVHVWEATPADGLGFAPVTATGVGVKTAVWLNGAGGSTNMLADVMYTAAGGGGTQLGLEISFTTDGTKNIVLDFASVKNAVNGPNVIMDLDNMSVIPEPATLGLVGVISAGLLFIRRFFMV